MSPTDKDSPPGCKVEEPSRKKQKMSEPEFKNADVLVTFIIGDKTAPTTFIVHKEVACHASPIFKIAFDSTFLEGQTQEYRMDDVTPRSFRLLVQWMYRKEIVTSLCSELPALSKKRSIASNDEGVTSIDEDEDNENNDGDSGIDSDNGSENDSSGSNEVSYGNDVEDDDQLEEDQALVEAYVLADRLLMPRLQNIVLRTIDALEDENYRIATSPLPWLCKNTTPESALWQYHIWKVAHEMAPRYIKHRPDYFPVAFLLDLAHHALEAFHPGGQALIKEHFDIFRYLVPEDEGADTKETPNPPEVS